MRSDYRLSWRKNIFSKNRETNTSPVTDIVYLFRDEFVTSRVAGAVDGTAAEPGPTQSRTVVDSNSLISIAGGQLIKATGAGGGAHDPIVQYQAGVTRESGKLLCGKVSGASSLWDTFWGYSNSLNTRPSATSFNFQISSTALRLYYNASLVVVGTYTGTGDYKLAIALRSSGAFYFIKGTEYSDWTLLGFNTGGTQAVLYATYGGQNATYQSDYIRVPKDLWIPSPLLSDGFSSSTSDGAGHAETSGIGSGGSGKTWDDSIGSWGVASGSRLASSLDGGIAINSCDIGSSDVIYEVAITRTAGVAGIVVKYIDSSNYVYAYHDGTNITLRQVVSGVDSELIAATSSAYADGRIIRLSVIGTSIRMFYNLSAIGGAVSIDSSLSGGTRVGLYTTDTANTFDNAICYAVGTGGEYSVLNRYFNSSANAIFTVGDSKTASGSYQNYLIPYLILKSEEKWIETSPRFAFSGYGADDMKLYMDSNLPLVYGPSPNYVLINLGVNDVGSLPLEADWKINYGAIIDSLHAKWPEATIVCMRVWREGEDSNCDTLNQWIDDLVLSRSFSIAGPDERIFLKGDDNGATYTVDGVHPTLEGYELTSLQWASVIGY